MLRSTWPEQLEVIRFSGSPPLLLCMTRDDFTLQDTPHAV
jgi:hypothetical protein